VSEHIERTNAASRQSFAGPVSPNEIRKRVRSLGRKALAALGAAARDHLDATGRAHTGTEAVPALADELARLIGPFHRSYSSRKLKTNEPGDGKTRHPGLIVMGWALIGCTAREVNSPAEANYAPKAADG
jgi:hypothetical protein